MVIVAALSGCGSKRSADSRTGLETLDAVLAPAAQAAALADLGGAHFHATATFRVEPLAKDPSADGTVPASPPTITTTTDLWLDRLGNFRLVESNDQDGGREIIRVGKEVAVALRYGKMVRRAAQDTESSRFLVEALGAPWAVWEVVRRQVEVDGGTAGGYRVKLSRRAVAWPPGFPAVVGLRKWRESAEVKTLEGRATVGPDGRTLIAFACKASFQAIRDAVPVEGDMSVTSSLDQVGSVAAIVMPSVDGLHPRQRTILEERALLGGLGAAISSAGKKAAP